LRTAGSERRGKEKGRQSVCFQRDGRLSQVLPGGRKGGDAKCRFVRQDGRKRGSGLLAAALGPEGEKKVRVESGAQRLLDEEKRGLPLSAKKRDVGVGVRFYAREKMARERTFARLLTGHLIGEKMRHASCSGKIKRRRRAPILRGARGKKNQAREPCSFASSNASFREGGSCTPLGAAPP